MSSPRTCYRCGTPAGSPDVPATRPVFCCAGCLIATQVPVDDKGNYPVNAALVTALAIGFVAFNQLLAWGLTALMASRGNDRAAALWAFGSLGAGAFVAFAAGREHRRAQAGFRPVDALLTAVAALLFAVGVALGAPGFGVLANAAVLAWCFRGFLKKKSGGKPSVTV